ncbi:lysozyme inhibitor LprI family protein [Pontibacter akesuensis]|uniref:Uncharacterized conserved protein YecT, DUF1311 family n=1 Tax=Pontibacter akesuensis TaxID=388950 RepID=A0A1I7K8K7_9BACT|nr:lysozyme inhibitor LprI family protein [Pontibacter akesuensis]GHA74269.1 hypothetical protein GCM10007389_29920 [Pontibacter akesuensis]SFU93774.1 Uncharacterized conserved protein YecT, DUF1311 family [Pontibacter akesuensis]
MKYNFLVILLLSISVPACAQTKAVVDCGNAQTQLEMNRCAAEAYQQADKALNDVYNAIIPKLSAEAKTLLVMAQQSWLVVRDSHCGLYEQFYEGGSMMPLMLYTCKTELTQNRTKELKAILEEVDDK